MNLQKVKLNESAFQKVKAGQEKKREDSPTEEQIPVPPTEEIPSPIREPVEEDQPTNPIIDEEKNGSDMIV